MLTPYLKQMQLYGIRRMLVLSGEQDWCYQQAHMLSFPSAGFPSADFPSTSQSTSIQPDADWLWLSDNKLSDPTAIPLSSARGLLGQQYLHAVFDATTGFHAEALAALTGTLQAGSILVLMLPEWSAWPYQQDEDSLRWTEGGEAIATPNFVRHVQHQILADSSVLTWRQGQRFSGTLLPERALWQPPTSGPTEPQLAVLNQLLTAKPGVYVLTAERGRGKSSVAGMLAAQWAGEGSCWLTAPAKVATATVQRWARKSLRFIAPDALLDECEQQSPAGVDWLIIDEAAAIPAPVLEQLISVFPRVLLTTTVQGYEGTGRGFILKFCAGLTNLTQLTLEQPIRWAEQDPLETLLNNLLLLDAEKDCQSDQTDGEQIILCSQSQLANNLFLLRQFYGLLTSAHYRTSPLDLRRLLDAPGMRFTLTLNQTNQVIAGVWGVEEGGLSASLAGEIWLGNRRPRGNLVAQSLVAHAGQRQAAILKSCRISRIAVNGERRRQGIARRLIEQQIQAERTAGVDYISVSFGYTEVLWAFWQACGFRLVQVGSQKEASSGCYAAMALIAFSQPAEQLVNACERRLKRDWRWLKTIIPLDLAIAGPEQQQLDDIDWLELAGFAYAHRPPEASRGALARLLLSCQNPDCALQLYLQQQQPLSEIVHQLGLAGKKDLIRLWRQEAARLMAQTDLKRSQYLQQNINQISNISESCFRLANSIE